MNDDQKHHEEPPHQRVVATIEYVDGTFKVLRTDDGWRQVQFQSLPSTVAACYQNDDLGILMIFPYASTKSIEIEMVR